MLNALGLLIAFIIGLFICIINYVLSKTLLIKKPETFLAATLFRQILNVGYMVACYFAAPYLPFSRTYLLIGAALGITLPMFYLTKKLTEIQQNPTSELTKNSDDKEE